MYNTDELNETDMILKALGKSAPVKAEKPKKRIMKEMDPDDLAPNDGLFFGFIDKEEQRKLKKSKTPVKKWNNLDFVRYLDSILKLHDLRLERLSVIDSQAIGLLYDKFVPALKDKMSPDILKDYIDWWVSCYASNMHGRKIYVASISQDFLIERFLTRFELEDTLGIRGNKVQAVAEKSSKDSTPITDAQLYKLGGLSMLLMSRGIVHAHNLLKPSDNNVIMRIAETLKKMSKEVVIEVLETTKNLSPYPISQVVDFMSMSKMALDFYGITKKYETVKYRSYFKD